MIKLENNTTKNLKQEKPYKYLGIKERNRIQYGTMKKKITRECYQRVRASLKM